MHELGPLTESPCCVLVVSERRGAVISFDLLDMKTVVACNQWNLWFIWGEMRFFIGMFASRCNLPALLWPTQEHPCLIFTVNLSWGQYKNWKWIWLFIYVEVNRPTLLDYSGDCLIYPSWLYVQEYSMNAVESSEWLAEGGIAHQLLYI